MSEETETTDLGEEGDIENNEKSVQILEEYSNGEVPSSFPEFAHCFIFFQKFGPQLSLPDVTLNELERFFQDSTSLENTDDRITEVHYNLLSNIVRKPLDKENWILFLTQLAYTNGFIEGRSSDYEDLDIRQRIQLLKFLCDFQFTRNNSFKNYVSKIPEDNYDTQLREKPIGLDRKGLRYWLLQDSVYDVRLYSEDKYLEYPFDHPKWNLLCISETQLKKFIEQFESIHLSVQNKEKEEKEMKKEKECLEKTNEDSSTTQRDEETSKRKRRNSSRIATSKKKKKEKEEEEEKRSVIGCMVCKKDTFYSKMLLCDGCDSECHTYCQYPIVWNIPEGEWFCPSCRELKLIKDLKRLHFELLEGIYLCEKRMEEEQKKLKRLQRGGLYVHNIITENVSSDIDAPRRSNRSKKDVDYAKLNELDIHVSTIRSARIGGVKSTKTTPYFTTNYYSTRRSRRTAIESEEKHEIKEVEKEEEAISCQLQVTTVLEQQTTEEEITQSTELLCRFPLVALDQPLLNTIQSTNDPLPKLPMSNVPVSNVPVSNVPVSNVQVSTVPVFNVPASNVSSSTSNAPVSSVPLLTSSVPSLTSSVPSLTSNVPLLTSSVPSLTSSVPLLTPSVSSLMSSVPLPTSNVPKSNVPSLTVSVPTPTSNVLAPPSMITVSSQHLSTAISHTTVQTPTVQTLMTSNTTTVKRSISSLLSSSSTVQGSSTLPNSSLKEIVNKNNIESKSEDKQLKEEQIMNNECHILSRKIINNNLHHATGTVNDHLIMSDLTNEQFCSFPQPISLSSSKELVIEPHNTQLAETGQEKEAPLFKQL